MLGWIRIYGHPCAGPAGPTRALASDTKSKTEGRHLDWSFENKTHSNRLEIPEKQKMVHPNRPSICNFDFLWCRYLVIGVTMH